ncbi:MAG TPA: sterol desaturase family protein, partial [Caulobacteraceae bacterium]|nr:sterol desaturase family protein [Caulobacteraceae bacterium]
MTFVEWLFPVRPQSFTPRLRSAVFWVLAAPVAGATMAVTYYALRMLGGHALITPRVWFGWDPITRGASLVIAPIVGAVIGDFFFYWGHRAEHAFFWRFHRVHHSIGELNAVNSYHHASEELFRTVLMVLPNALLFSPDVGPT